MKKMFLMEWVTVQNLIFGKAGSVVVVVFR